MFLLLYTSPGNCFFLSCPASLGCSDSRCAPLLSAISEGCELWSLSCSHGITPASGTCHCLFVPGSARRLRSAREIRTLQGLRQSQSCEGAFPAPGWLHYNCCGCICTRRDLPSFLVFTFIAAVPQVMQTAGNLSISVLLNLCSIGFPWHSLHLGQPAACFMHRLYTHRFYSRSFLSQSNPPNTSRPTAPARLVAGPRAGLRWPARPERESPHRCRLFS